MKCRVAREWMRARIDQSLTPEVGGALDAHLDSCSRCAAEARDLEQLGGLLGELPLAEPSANFDWRLRLRLSKAEPGEVSLFAAERRRAWPRLEFWGAAAAAALVVVATGLYLLRAPSDAPAPRGLSTPAVVDNRPRPEAGSLLTPVRDGPLVGPQRPVPYGHLLFPQQMGPPAPTAAPDTTPVSAPAAR